MCPGTEAVDCPSLDDPTDGTVITNDPSCSLTAIAKYTCNPGFVPEGDTIRCCVDDGTGTDAVWTGSVAKCVGKLHLNLKGIGS